MSAQFPCWRHHASRPARLCPTAEDVARDCPDEAGWRDTPKAARAVAAPIAEPVAEPVAPEPPRQKRPYRRRGAEG